MAAAFELGGEKDFQRLARHLRADQALAERHDIGVIMLARQTRRSDVMDDGGAYPWVAVGGDRHADSGAADQDAAVGLARGDGVGYGVAEVGIIDRLDRVGAEIQHLVTRLLQVALENLLEVEAGMLPPARARAPPHLDDRSPLAVDLPVTISGAAMSRSPQNRGKRPTRH